MPPWKPLTVPALPGRINELPRTTTTKLTFLPELSQHRTHRATRALRLDGEVIREADGFFEVAVGLHGKEPIPQVTLEGSDVVAQG